MKNKIVYVVSGTLSDSTPITPIYTTDVKEAAMKISALALSDDLQESMVRNADTDEIYTFIKVERDEWGTKMRSGTSTDFSKLLQAAGDIL